MPWCERCDRFLNPNTVQPDGTCPSCGRTVDAGAVAPEQPEEEKEVSSDGYAKATSEAYNRAAADLYSAQAADVDIIITTALSISDGRLYEAETLREVWPRNREVGSVWWRRIEPAR